MHSFRRRPRRPPAPRPLDRAPGVGRHRLVVVVAAVAAMAAALVAVGASTGATAADAPTAPRRRVAPVVLTGAQLPAWSRLPATGFANPPNPVDDVRDAHHGSLVVPPDHRTGVDPEHVVAFRWDATGGTWTEVPVQVDERFPHFLANFRSDFGPYSQTDVELTYEWDDERWRRTEGQCVGEYPPGARPKTEDPVPTLDDDDEVVFMASDAGDRATPATPGPARTAVTRHEVALVDPATGTAGYVYLFIRGDGSGIAEGDGYVDYQRDPDAFRWIDRSSFAAGDPEALGTSNGGYGPNLPGTVCEIDPVTGEVVVRTSQDRFLRDGVTVETDTYRWRATGRWMVRGMQVTKPGTVRDYGPDLVDRWKGRAFQQSPDSAISAVGFEDEQVNWEANSAVLGDRVGPVRAIREVWGADSGTNVTKTETFYRDAITYRYRLRVHPIPPDGIYTSWDYNASVARRYFTPVRPAGVVIDGTNDDVGNVDAIGSFPAFFDAPDPTLNVPATVLTWEQVSGRGDAGSLVYVVENKGTTSATEPAVVPYYRDDKCFDDGTGDDPVPRPWPGESSTDARVRDGYTAAAGKASYAEVTCDERQGAWGSHGIHFFATGDTDNLFLNAPVPVNEVDAQQWQFAVPTSRPTNVGDAYSLEVRAPVVPVAVEQRNPVATELTYVGVTSVEATDAVDVVFELKTLDGTPVGGRRVALAFRGATAERTSAAGTGRVAFRTTAEPPTGAYPATASFAGDDVFASSDGAGTITVVHDRAALRLAVAPGGSATASLRDADSGAPLAGRAVSFQVNGSGTVTRTTNSDGSATVQLTVVAGDRVKARFAGDDAYRATSAAIVVG